MKTFTLSVTSPEGNLFLGEVMQISVRGVEGDLAIMAGHIPFVTALAEGECLLKGRANVDLVGARIIRQYRRGVTEGGGGENKMADLCIPCQPFLIGDGAAFC